MDRDEFVTIRSNNNVGDRTTWYESPCAIRIRRPKRYRCYLVTAHDFCGWISTRRNPVFDQRHWRYRLAQSLRHNHQSAQSRPRTTSVRRCGHSRRLQSPQLLPELRRIAQRFRSPHNINRAFLRKERPEGIRDRFLISREREVERHSDPPNLEPRYNDHRPIVVLRGP